MKILHIPTGGLFSDGIGSFIYSYLEQMDLQKFDVTLLATNTPLPEDKGKFEQLNVKIVEIPRKKKAILTYMRKLHRLLKQENYDIVHVHGSSALMSIELLAAKMAGVPVRIAHSHNTTCDHMTLDKALRPLFNSLYTQAWACGEGAGHWLFGQRDFTIIHNARDTKAYAFSEEKRQAFRRANHISDETLALGHVGRFNAQKNQAFLISVMSELKKREVDAQLFLVGVGEKLEELKNVVSEKKLDDYVTFLGQRDDMQSFVSAMDMMLLPSFYEGLPLVSVEWQINGVPSLLSDTITDECIFTNSVKQLSIKIPEDWQKDIMNWKPIDRVEQSRKNIQKTRENGYDISLEAQNLEQLYSKLVRK